MPITIKLSHEFYDRDDLNKRNITLSDARLESVLVRELRAQTRWMTFLWVALVAWFVLLS